MSFTSSVRKIDVRWVATAFDLRLADERRGDTPDHVKVTCRHVMFTANEKCQPLRNLLYIDRVEIMSNLIESIKREANWTLSVINKINDSMVFAYERINYAQSFSAYYAEMSNLPTEHPDVHEYLNNDGFSVQIGATNPFGRIPVDQTIEKTINKDTQKQGGTKGFSLKPGAINKVHLTAEYRNSCLHWNFTTRIFKQPKYQEMSMMCRIWLSCSKITR